MIMPAPQWYENALAPFHALNPESALGHEDSGACVISKPWGDDTLVVRVAQEAEQLITALNAVRLPPQFSAVWHQASKDIEFIFAPYPLDYPLLARSFEFQFGDKMFKCEYAPASEQLLIIGAAARPIEAPSETNHRNIATLRSFVRLKKPVTAGGTPVVQVSFWMRNVDVGAEELANIARHLNFYSSYFDRHAPIILVHGPQIAEDLPAWGAQFPCGQYPGTIVGRPLDPFLLGLWEASTRAPDPMRRYLNSYQVFEYASFYWVREEIQRSVRRIMTSPAIVARVDEATREVIDLLVEERASDDSKIVSVIQATVDPAIVWQEISSRGDFFCEPTEFEGGFTLPALCKKGWALEDFASAWIPKLPDSLRKIRNALVHAREQRQSRAIVPSDRNQMLIRPWAAVAATLASQVILFGDTNGSRGV